MKSFKCYSLLLLVVFSLIPVHATQAYYASKIEMIEHELDFLFGEFIEINAQFPADVNISTVQLIMSATEKTISSDVFDLALLPENRVSFSYDFNQSRNFPAFTSIRYYFVITTVGGQQLETAPEELNYVDNRFEWQVLNTNEQFVIHWYSGDLAFAQSVLTAAQNSLDFADQFVKLPNSSRVRIFVYTSGADLRKALNIPSNAPVTGHANPANHLILLSIRLGVEQTSDIERHVPHEISHIRLYDETGEDYDQIPNWLREGLATLSELYPNPDFGAALDLAAQQGSLLSFEQLCDPFPTDNRNAFLAYAQSQSFVQYVFEEYGSSGLDAIIQSYVDGTSCANGTIAGTDKSLSQLERSWQVWRFSAPQNVDTTDESPALAWMLLLLIPLLWPIISILIRKR